MIAIELVDPGTRQPRRRAHAGASRRPATPNGVVVLTCGTYGNVLRFLPPLIISEDLLIEGLGVIAEGLKNA